MRDSRLILRDVKALAIEYYEATGKPLGITGEIAESEAAHALGLELSPARTAGFDAVRKAPGREDRIQIKGRWKPKGMSWGRVPPISASHDFDSVMLVLMSGPYELEEIWEAPRERVIAALDRPGSKARNERRSLGVRQFIAIADRVWPPSPAL